MASDAEWAWAAGVFEGEGCLTHSWNKAKTKKYYRAVVEMTDEDVISRFYRITDMGYKTPARTRNSSRKATWTWRVTREEDLRELISRFLPWMGVRRRAKAEEVLRDM